MTSASSRLAARASPRTSGDAPGTASDRPPGPPGRRRDPGAGAAVVAGTRAHDAALTSMASTGVASTCAAARAGVAPSPTRRCMRTRRRQSVSV